MARHKLDAYDIRILAAVQREGRITKVALAEQVGLSPTPCWNRLRRLEEAGLIAGYHAHLEPKAFGAVAVVFVEVTLANHRQIDFDRFEKAARAVPEIVGCWSLGGGIDYLIKVVARDIDAYQRLIDRLLEHEIGIERYFTYIVTKSLKDGSAIPVDRLVDPE
jgi:Lrp/AsnC family transcriptional regulator of ectoine degradation